MLNFNINNNKTSWYTQHGHSKRRYTENKYRIRRITHSTMIESQGIAKFRSRARPPFCLRPTNSDPCRIFRIEDKCFSSSGFNPIYNCVSSRCSWNHSKNWKKTDLEIFKMPHLYRYRWFTIRLYRYSGFTRGDIRYTSIRYRYTIR